VASGGIAALIEHKSDGLRCRVTTFPISRGFRSSEVEPPGEGLHGANAGRGFGENCGSAVEVCTVQSVPRSRLPFLLPKTTTDKVTNHYQEGLGRDMFVGSEY
jgi:hypothetical protein